MKPTTPAVPVPEQITKELTVVGRNINAMTLVTKPTSATEVATATAQFNQLKSIEKEVKAKETGITSPLNLALKNVRALFTPVKDRLATAISSVRSGLDTYNREAQLELQRQREKLERKVESGKVSESKAGRLMAELGSDLGAGVIPTRKHKVVKVVDEAKVPDRYWFIDEQMIRKDALAGVKIPGVEVVEEELVVAGR